MKIGVGMIFTSESMDVAPLAQKAEELGFESFWLAEHTIMPVNITSLYDGTPDGSIPQFMNYMIDPFIGLARASAVTQRLKLGTGICLVPEHNPLLLAKRIATLDHLSNGRFIFGIGIRLAERGDGDHGWGLRAPAGARPGKLFCHERAMDQRGI